MVILMLIVELLFLICLREENIRKENKMIYEELNNIILKYNIPKKSMKLYLDYIANLESTNQEIFHDIQEQFYKDKIYAEIQTISYVLGNWGEANEENIVVSISMICENQGIGNYEVTFSVDGDVISENLEIY